MGKKITENIKGKLYLKKDKDGQWKIYNSDLQAPNLEKEIGDLQNIGM
jgi:hypothetical protein